MFGLLRRLAVLTVVSGLGMALLVPLTARSATPIAQRPAALLPAPASAAVDAARDRNAGRERAARLSLAEIHAGVAVEVLAPSTPVPAPGRVAVAPSFRSKPAPPPVTAVVARAAPPPMTGGTVTGSATWYCCSLGWRGVAVVALPGALGGHYDAPPASRYVTICADRCASIPVVDFCACHWGTASQKVADLSPEAWAAISDRSRSAGVIRVTIHLG